ncbi:MAG TPA: hypothetical protein VFU99_06440 [Gaiellaceae bacterium]|jgi:hypothetical protein|nr:hypothetical protein [Gaiellaceae bacterium]
MKRTFTWLVLVGGVLVVLAVLWQAFSIAAYVRGAGDGALDAHGAGSLFVHIGQLAIVIGAIVAYWGNWRMVGGAVGFLVLAIAQLAFLGDTEEEGDWINGLHGFLAVVIALLGVWYANRAANDLGVRRSGGVAGSA